MPDPLELHGIDLQGIFNSLVDRSGMSRYQIAKETGMSQAILSAYATGHRRPTLEALCTLADLVDVKIDVVIRDARGGR